MNLCKTCKHWTPYGDKGAGVCSKLTDAPPGQGVIVYSDSDPVCTEEEFGCVHHEATPSPEEQHFEERGKRMPVSFPDSEA